MAAIGNCPFNFSSALQIYNSTWTQGNFGPFYHFGLELPRLRVQFHCNANVKYLWKGLLVYFSTTDWNYWLEIPCKYYTWYLFFSSSSLLAFFLCAGMSWARRSFASSLSFLAAAGGSPVNWNVNEFPSWRTSWICILELPSGLIRWTVMTQINWDWQGFTWLQWIIPNCT